MIARTDKSLTSAYKELECITYTGSQYIDTGYIPSYTNGFKIEIDFSIAATGYRYLLLSTYNQGNALSLEITTSNYLRLYMNNGNLDTTLAAAITANTRHKAIFEFDPSTKYYTITLLDDSSRTASYTTATTEPTYSMYMFVDRALRYSTFNHNLTIYSCNISSNTELLKSFVPAKQISNNAIGMVDILTNTFYANKGSGTFTSGGLKVTKGFKAPITRLPQDYQEVEYITFSGAQCIRTGVSELVHPYSVRTVYNKTNTEATDQCLVGQRQIGKFSNLFNHYYESAYGNTSSGSLLENQKATLLMKSGEGVIVNGTNILSTSSTATVSTSYELLIGSFSEDSYSNAKWFYNGYIYDIQIVSNNELIRHYIPCYRKSDNVYGLYDIINDTFNTTTTSTPLSGGSKPSIKYIARVPFASNYTRVEYLQSSGAQWIVIPTNLDCDYFEFSTQYNNTNSEQCIVGNADTAGNRVEIFCSTGRLQYSIWTDYNSQGTTQGTVNAIQKAKISYDYSTNEFKVNETDNISKIFTSKPKIIFGYNGSSYNSNAKLYYFLEKKNGSIVMNLIPVIRNSDNKPGLYDIVNKVFYTNQGTGDDFTYGKKII